MPVKFTLINEEDNPSLLNGKKDRYMCPITRDILTNTTRCAYLKTSYDLAFYMLQKTGV